MRNRLPLIAGILASFLLGFSFLSTKTGLTINGHDSMSFLAFRYLIAFPIMALLVRLNLFKIQLRGKDIRLLLLCGLLNPIISQFLELLSLKYAPTSQLALFLSLLPVFVLLLSATINREKPTNKQIAFIFLSVAGVFTIQFANVHSNDSLTLGFVLSLLVSLVVAIQRVLVRRASGRFSAFEIIFVSAGMGFIYFPVVSIAEHIAKGNLSNYFNNFSNPIFVISVLYFSIICYVVGFLLMTYASANLPIAVSSATNTLSTAVSVFAGVVFLHEGFRLIDALGAVLIIGAIFFMSFSYNPSISNKFKDATSDSLS